MAWRKHDAGVNIAEFKGLPVLEQAVPLAPVFGKVRPVIDPFPKLLNVHHTFADRSWRRRLGL